MRIFTVKMHQIAYFNVFCARITAFLLTKINKGNDFELRKEAQISFKIVRLITFVRIFTCNMVRFAYLYV